MLTYKRGQKVGSMLSQMPDEEHQPNYSDPVSNIKSKSESNTVTVRAKFQTDDDTGEIFIAPVES